MTFLNIRVLSSHFKTLGTIFPKANVGAELIRDVKRWRHAWLIIIHVHVHVADDVLYDFIKLINTERRSNAARMQVQHWN